jgi:hypothetical protein
MDSDINKAGSEFSLPRSASRAERIALIEKYHELKRKNHAVVMDETHEQDEEYGVIRILHYKTCLRCAGAR